MPSISAQEATVRRYKTMSSKMKGLNKDILKNDTVDNYRTFIAMENSIRNPPTLAYQPLFQIAPEMQKFVIEK